MAKKPTQSKEPVSVSTLTEELHQLSDQIDSISERLKILEELHVHETMFRGTEGETIENPKNTVTS